MMQVSLPISGAQPRPDGLTQAQRTARAVEAQFLSQFLQAAGVGRPAQTFGGGIGEEQFASLLVDEHAKAMAARGGIGVAEMLLRSMGGEGDGR